MSRNVVVLLGGPGAGKGTQARAIAAWLGIPHISTGQLLRSEIAAATELGLVVKAIIDAGDLVSDEIVMDVVARRIGRNDCNRGFILDGYPRDQNQAVMFNRAMAQDDKLIVIDIEVDLEKIMPRLTGRRTCGSCNAIFHTVLSPPQREGLCDHCGDVLIQRSDDREEVIRERFKTYIERTKPLAEFYGQQHVYHRIEGMQSADCVESEIRESLENEIARSPGAVGCGV